jgi:anaphase-promoting complex subunit 1
MGLDDHDSDRLAQEIIFRKIKSIEFKQSNSRISLSRPATGENRVFVLHGPAYAVDEQQRNQLLICIQDHVEKRLQVLTMSFQKRDKFDLATKMERSGIVMACEDSLQMQNVIDACKIVDGALPMILILSEKHEGGHKLSILAPWAQITTIKLPLMLLDNALSIQYRRRKVDRDVRQLKPETIEMASGSIVRLEHPRNRGIVDMVDKHGRQHQVQIQLQPSSPQVRRVLDVFRSVLPHPHGGKMASGWWHVMQWGGRESVNAVDVEWSCLVIHLFAVFLALGRSSVASDKKQQTQSRQKPTAAASSSGPLAASGDAWDTLNLHEARNSAVCPPWMLCRGWQWAMDEYLSDVAESVSDRQKPRLKGNFVQVHIQYAHQFLSSSFGEAALGKAGYLPTALSMPLDYRRKYASSLFVALHLLVEEQKLDVMTPENGHYGTIHLRVVLCQIARWLEWHDLATLYTLGIQEETDSRLDSGKDGPSLF